jgi:hypothetical protein
MTVDAEMTDRAERCWVYSTLAVTLARVDFLDPALADRPDTRERGVRVELRPVRLGTGSSIYASPQIGLEPAVCRIDLLESAPRAADRMHWHPVMIAGEPDDREYVPEMGADPVAWLSDRLREVEVLLDKAGIDDVARHRSAVSAIAEDVDDIAAAARAGLEWAREDWSEVPRDERGMGH